MKYIALLTLLLTGPAFADQQAIPMNATPAADQVGHIFVAGCEPKLPPLMETQFALFETAFGYTARDLGTDAAFGNADDSVIVSFDANYAGATCEMTVSSAVSGDGAAVYESLIAHLESEVKALPAAQAVDGGLLWEWTEDGTVSIDYTIEFLETPEGHILRTQAKQF